MSRIRSKNTAPELAVRKALTGQGLHYRLHVRNLPGNPDIAMRRIKTAIFVNGCFWHQHPGCKRNSFPKSNTAYWKPKLQRNIDRQMKAFAELEKEDWNVVTVWECEAKKEDILNKKLERTLGL